MPAVSLFPHETIFASARGSVFFWPERLGLPMVNMGTRERHAASCEVFITQYRVLCDAHWLNRFRGTTTVLLDTITDAHEVPAMPSAHLHLMAGMPYEFAFFAVEEPRTALALALQQSNPERCGAGRANLLRELFPHGLGNQPPRAAVRGVLDSLIISPDTLLRALALNNLWLSLGNGSA